MGPEAIPNPIAKLSDETGEAPGSSAQWTNGRREPNDKCPRRPNSPLIALLPATELRNLNLARLGFLTLVQRDLQEAAVELGLNALLIDGRRKGEAADEAVI